MIFYDTEGAGLVAPLTLIQWARDEGPVHLHEVWTQPCKKTLALIERLVDDALCGFNLTHDHFHLQRTHNVLRLLPKDRPPTIDGWCRVERKATEGPCVKPASALDLMLFARLGPWQSLMNRDNIRIRKVPRAMAQPMADYLTRNFKMDPIYFSRREHGYLWEVAVDEDNPDFPDVVLRFSASGSLKALGRHISGQDWPDFPVEESRMPEETLWDPIGSREWTRVLPYHIAFWKTTPRARKYAADDVILTRDVLWKSFGCPPAGDVDSVLACQVASARWRGYAVDAAKAAQVRDEATVRMNAAPRAPQPVLHGLKSLCSPVEAISIENTTGQTLERIGGQWNEKNKIWTGSNWGETHPAVPFARSVMRARSAEKEVDGAKKLIQGVRLHPDMRIVGAKSGRMSGAGKFNVMGLSDSLKECLLLADGSLPVLDGGDAWSFEVCIAAAVYNDKNLTADLKKHKLHALFAADVLEMRYEDIYDDEHDVPVNKPIYQQGKVAMLARLYGAQDPKLASIFGRPVADVRAGSARLEARYPGIAIARARVANGFCSMRQAVEGGRVEWHEPLNQVESMFGYSRSFKLENDVCRVLYEMAQAPPTELQGIEGCLVERRKGRVQTMGGAVQTALFSCAFGIQGANMRAAANHEIQAAGARITKEVQAEIWELQPAGIHPWVVQPLNEHDSVMVPRRRGAPAGNRVATAVARTVSRYQPRVPLLRIDWHSDVPNWRAK